MKDKLVILYHTNLSGNLSAGPTYSVPKQILAQSKIDDVMWINNGNVILSEWENTGVFYTRDQLGFRTLEDLPKPFNHPDIVVFESFFQMADVKLSHELNKKMIPYIIVPRGALTKEAQRIKKYKKLLGNFLYFKSFSRHAAGIQYLTEKECTDSGEKWNKNTFIIPNGIDIPNVTKCVFSENKIIFSFVGRIAIRHKGLDLLIDAVEMSAELLRSNKCKFNLYGPDDSGSVETLKSLIGSKELGDLIEIFAGVYGKDKEDVLLNTDVFVLTSRFEGHPMGLIEALSYGIPALVTTGSNMRNEIDEYDAGWTCDCSAEDINKSILEILNGVSTMELVGKNARLLAECYRWEALSEKAHSVFVTLLESR